MSVEPEPELQALAPAIKNCLCSGPTALALQWVLRSLKERLIDVALQSFLTRGVFISVTKMKAFNADWLL